MESLASCDTFVCLPPKTLKDLVIFGKNSDRPAKEVQEVIYCPKKSHAPGSKVTCTYIAIDQVAETLSCILSKPAWMWGAEMGSNDRGVCIGNEAVWTKVKSESEEKLLGMDLVRLGLERGTTARHALDVMTDLLATHGQGGPCSETMTDFTYHNSFIIADSKEAWVLETAGQYWAAEKVESGFRNISNCLSIGTRIDLMSPGLKEAALKLAFWDGTGEMNFAETFGVGSDDSRYKEGKKLLNQLSKDNQFGVSSMIRILRDKKSGICRPCCDAFPSASSQVSVLSPAASTRPHCHWFTGTPDPEHSVFKPFIFCDTVQLTCSIRSPTFPDGEDPAKVKPRFKRQVDRRHLLYKLHEACYPKLIHSTGGDKLRQTLRELESNCINEVEEALTQFTVDDTKLELNELFNDSVEAELRFYK